MNKYIIASYNNYSVGHTTKKDPIIDAITNRQFNGKITRKGTLPSTPYMYVYEIQSDAMIPNFTNIGNTYIKWDVTPSVKSVRVDKLDDYIVGTRFSSPNNQNNLWIMAKDPENNELILSSIKPVSESEFKFDGLIGGPKSSGGSKKSRTKPKKKISKTNPKKISKTKTKKSPKIHTGPRGGKYIVKKGKKIYQ